MVSPEHYNFGAAFKPDGPMFPCLICGAAVPGPGRAMHWQWHTDTADVVIETTRRVDVLERGGQQNG